MVSGPRSTNLLADDLENGYDGRQVIHAEQDPAVRVPLVSQTMGLAALKTATAGLDRSV